MSLEQDEPYEEESLNPDEDDGEDEDGDEDAEEANGDEALSPSSQIAGGGRMSRDRSLAPKREKAGRCRSKATPRLSGRTRLTRNGAQNDCGECRQPASDQPGVDETPAVGKRRNQRLRRHVAGLLHFKERKSLSVS